MPGNVPLGLSDLLLNSQESFDLEKAAPAQQF